MSLGPTVRRLGRVPGAGLGGRGDRRRRELWSPAVPVVAFAALAGFAAVHWSALVVDPPLWRTAAVVAIVTVGGVAAARVRSPAGKRLSIAAARAAILLGTLAAAMVAVGVSPGLVWPGGWDRFADGLARGLSGLQTLQWPYRGPDPWVRLTVLLAIPVTLCVAAALAFRPADRRAAAPASGLVLLLALYGVAASQRDVAAPLVQGTMLLMLIGAWLFLPRIGRRGALAAATMVLVALAAALPLAGGLAASEPIIDYSSWRWLGDPTRYGWDHAYGPIDWPRSGETVLSVESRRPHYWKAAALDRFDGLRWVRSGTAASVGPDPLVPTDPPRRWIADVTVTVEALDSTLLVSPGSVQDVEGPSTGTPTRDGAARTDQELEQGSTYTVRAYAPNPSAARLRAAPDPSPFAVRSSTIVNLPAEGTTNLNAPADDTEATVSGRPVVLPRYDDGLGATPDAEEYVADSPYAPVLRLARRLVAGAPTTYAAVRRIEAHLREQYEYDEQPPHREYPLAAFLDEDRAGYCQHFAGAMALMLRMTGIPARVAAGFAPGQREPGSDVFSVRDLDAHSWVEVYFSGIGWVPFDPTPPGAPTASRAESGLATAARGDGSGLGLDLAELLEGDGVPGSDSGAQGLPDAADGAAASPGAAGPPWPAVAGGAALLAAGALWLVRRPRRAGPDGPVEELERALRRLGHPVAPGTTLMELERRLGRAGHPTAARYIRRVREQRFAGRRPPADPAERRALRSALTARAGFGRRMHGYAVLPPRRRLSPFSAD